MTTNEYISENKTDTLKKGDKVEMLDCYEANWPENKDKTWICLTDSFLSLSKTDVVYLEGFSGYFYTKYLKKNMKTIEILENKIRNAIPELRDEYEIFQESTIDADMITPIMLNHVLEYFGTIASSFKYIREDGRILLFEGGPTDIFWNLKYGFLKNQSIEMITFLNDLK